MRQGVTDSGTPADHDDSWQATAAARFWLLQAGLGGIYSCLTRGGGKYEPSLTAFNGPKNRIVTRNA
jgi:hypothetical protein